MSVALRRHGATRIDATPGESWFWRKDAMCVTAQKAARKCSGGTLLGNAAVLGMDDLADVL